MANTPIPKQEVDDAMTPQDYMEAARVPRSIEPQDFGLWRIERIRASRLPEKIDAETLSMPSRWCGWPDYTMLSKFTEATLHRIRGDIVMEDSQRELRKHLPIWMKARGRVLVTGLGLGCVVRGLLANRDVDRVEVVEIDRDIARVIGAEFAGNSRVGITVGDALDNELPAWLPGRFDCGWHDLWVDGPNLQLLHAELFFRFGDRCGPQGAWAFPREFARLWAKRHNQNLLGAPRYV